jgi:hypothetical protein
MREHAVWLTAALLLCTVSVHPFGVGVGFSISTLSHGRAAGSDQTRLGRDARGSPSPDRLERRPRRMPRTVPASSQLLPPGRPPGDLDGDLLLTVSCYIDRMSAAIRGRCLASGMRPVGDRRIVRLVGEGDECFYSGRGIAFRGNIDCFTVRKKSSRKSPAMSSRAHKSFAGVSAVANAELVTEKIKSSHSQLSRLKHSPLLPPPLVSPFPGLAYFAEPEPKCQVMCLAAVCATGTWMARSRAHAVFLRAFVLLRRRVRVIAIPPLGSPLLSRPRVHRKHRRPREVSYC